MASDNWFRNSMLGVILSVVIAALVVGIVSISNSASNQSELKTQAAQLATQEATLKANLLAQVSNRTKNVAVWCGAIDAERTVLVDYISSFNKNQARIPALVLPQLDCAALENSTLASARHK